VEWVEPEAFGLNCPLFVDELVWREAFQGLQAPAEVVGGDAVGEVMSELVVAGVVEALDGRVLDGPVHSLDLTICPRVPRLGQSVLDVEISASRLEGVAAEEYVLGPHGLDILGRPAVAA